MSNPLTIDEDLQVCQTCGTQFDVPLSAHPEITDCKICDDPRQYVPPAGQKWTSLKQIRSESHKNLREVDPIDPRVTQIWTEPKADIGQRCFLLQTEHGNVLWDLIAKIDQETYDFIMSKGGLEAIVISHPHYYSTHLTWAKVFKCPVYIAAEDEEWTVRSDPDGLRRHVNGPILEVLPGVTVIKCGGHFPGSLVLHWENKLFHADTFKTVPSGMYHINRPPGTASFCFMWSYPNMIPMNPDGVLGIWKAIEPYNFDVTYDAFHDLTIRSPDVKKRLLESMKIHTKTVGFLDHALLSEEY